MVNNYVDINSRFKKIFSFPEDTKNITLELLANAIYDFYGKDYVDSKLQNKEIINGEEMYINIHNQKEFFSLLLKTLSKTNNITDTLISINTLESNYANYFKQRFSISIDNILSNNIKTTISNYDIFTYLNNISKQADKNILIKLYLKTIIDYPQITYTIKNTSKTETFINKVVSKITTYINSIILPLKPTRFLINKTLVNRLHYNIETDLGYYKDGDAKFASIFFCGLSILNKINPTILDMPYHYKDSQFNNIEAKEINVNGKIILDMCLINMSMNLFENNYTPFIDYITITNTKRYTTFSEISENIFRFFIKYLHENNKSLPYTNIENTEDEIINFKKKQTASYVNMILKEFFYIPDNKVKNDTNDFIFSDFEFTDYENNYVDDNWTTWRGDYANCVWEYIFFRNNGGNDTSEEDILPPKCNSLVEYISNFNDNKDNIKKITIRDCCFNTDKIYSEYNKYKNTELFSKETINFYDLVHNVIYQGMISTEIYQILGYPQFYEDFISIMKGVQVNIE